MNRKTTLRGFTLIELMVVVLLIAILAAVIVPEMKGTYDDARLRATGRDLLSVFNLASSRAVSLNQAHRVLIDPIESRYFLEKRIRDDSQGGEFVPVKDVPDSEGKLDRAIAISIRRPPPGEETSGGDGPPLDGGPGTDTPGLRGGISFYPDGTADAVEIELKDREGFRLGLRMNPVTARARIVELSRE